MAEGKDAFQGGDAKFQPQRVLSGAYKDNIFRPSPVFHLSSNFPRRWLSPVIDAPALISCARADCEVGMFLGHHQRSDRVSDGHSETTSQI
jgi:hypothetical protein